MLQKFLERKLISHKKGGRSLATVKEGERVMTIVSSPEPTIGIVGAQTFD
jgi:hypothetical protein